MTAAAATIESVTAARSETADTWTALVNATASWAELSPELFRHADWQNLAAAAEHHGVFPVLCKRVFESSLAESLAPAVRDRLRRRSQAHLLRSLPLIEETLRIVDEFERRNIAIIPYKGPAIAEQLWGDATQRVCDDLDFLVEKKNVEPAGDLLDRLGYSRVSPVAPHLRPALLRNASEEQFRHRETGLLLELQWSPAPRVFALGYGSDPMWERLATASLTGRRVSAPAPEHLLVLLSIHGWKHNWSKLIWVGDIAHLLRSYLIEWDQLYADCRTKRRVRLLALALRMANRIYGVALPAPFDFADAALDALVSELVSRMAANTLCSYREWHRFMLAARDSEFDKVKQMASFLLTPGLGEYATSALPGWAAGGYRVVRLGRLLLHARGKGA